MMFRANQLVFFIAILIAIFGQSWVATTIQRPKFNLGKVPMLLITSSILTGVLYLLFWLTKVGNVTEKFQFENGQRIVNEKQENM